MRRLTFIAFLLLSMTALLLAGCGSKKTEPQATAEAPKTEAPATETPTSVDAKGSVLRAGQSACLVVFPKPEGEGEWLSLVKLKGAQDTDRLPRIPLASSSTITLLNIPPGEYEIFASAWLRKSPPYAGGKSQTVTLKAGELLILRAPKLPAGGDSNPDNSTLTEAGRRSWTVTAPQQLPLYIAEAAKTVRG